MTFTRGKTYCELCLDEIDPFNLNEGYTLCCNERSVNSIEASQIDRNYEKDCNQ